jgi:prepilin-type N-terminal cleavage/methylation domain-containing protein
LEFMNTASIIKIDLKRQKTTTKAFTLVELLVVISIISLLMAILVPSLGKARASAKRAVCQSNLKQIGIGFKTYLDDNRDIMPPASDFPWDITNPFNDPNNPYYTPPITKFLMPILKQSEVFICKEDTIQKYYLRTGHTSYQYYRQLGGTSMSASFLEKSGIKEKNIHVMSDFDPVHTGFSGVFTKKSMQRTGKKNYLYADWHIGDYKDQD